MSEHSSIQTQGSALSEQLSTDNVATLTHTEWTRKQWNLRQGAFRKPLNCHDVIFKRLSKEIAIEELNDVYQPLALSIGRGIAQKRRQTHSKTAHKPFMIGISGSVSSGKTTLARLFKELLLSVERSNDIRVEIVSMDNFLYSNHQLQEKGLFDKKGFPETYNYLALLNCIRALNADETVRTPVYSHLHYDLVPGQEQVLEHPDVVLFEGINLFHSFTVYAQGAKIQLALSDCMDLTFYIDAPEDALQNWYLKRFRTLREEAQHSKDGGFYDRFVSMTDKEAQDRAVRAWETINLVNLRSYIAPRRLNAHCILNKSATHSIRAILIKHDCFIGFEDQ